MKAILITTTALALTTGASANPNFDEQVNEQLRFMSNLDDAPISSASIRDRNAIELSAGTENDNISIEIGKKSGPSIWSISLSAPIDDLDEQPLTPDLDGLANAIRAKLSYKRIIGKPTLFTDTAEFGNVDDPSNFAELARAFMKAKDAICIEAAKLKDLENPESFTGDNCTDDVPDGATRLFTLSPEEEAGLGGSADGIAASLRKLENQYDCLLWSGVNTSECRKTITSFELSATAGTEEFDFLDADTLAKRSRNESVYAVEASLDFIRIPSSWVYRIAYRHEDTYSSAPSQTLCMPATPPFLSCQTGAVGEPINKETDILTVEARRSFAKLGIAPKVAYDIDEEVLGVDLPVYFVRNDKGVLTGGVNFGWRDDEKDLVISAFFGRTFKLFQ